MAVKPIHWIDIRALQKRKEALFSSLSQAKRFADIEIVVAFYLQFWKARNKPIHLINMKLHSLSWGLLQAMAKLGDLSRVTLYSACLLGWLNMRMTSEQHASSHLHVVDTRNVSVVSQKHLCVSCYKFCLALQSFRGGWTGSHGGDISVTCDMSHSLAGP